MSRIGDYDLLEQLGEGNHGTFYTARPPARLGLDVDVVAVKVMGAHATDKDFRRVATELRIFSSLKSDHLVEVYDAGHQDGQLFYAMSWYPDGSLDAPANELTRAATVRVVADAARGAHALHEVGVVHRDIKPANVLLDGDRGKLSDLGLAQMLTPGMTTTGVGPIGSIEYMEPDVIWGGKAARASDIWSLGLTLHRAVAGAGVYGVIPEQNVLDAFRHVLHTPPRLSPAMGELLPIVERTVAPERADRYPTALDLAEDLERVGG